jgi:hypothetical protein
MALTVRYEVNWCGKKPLHFCSCLFVQAWAREQLRKVPRNWDDMMQLRKLA